MKKLVIGILAHVDAGKTTLSEGLLYTSGNIRKMGRVDNRDAFLDTFELERARGITIFSKQAVLNIDDTQITLLDTPGHVDFSAEMERTLQVLDYAILVVSAADGIQGHTQTLWSLLLRYNIPVFLFVNKMDQLGTNREEILEEIKKTLGDECVDFTTAGSSEFYEEIAMTEEAMLEEFLDTGVISETKILRAIAQRHVYPVFFGSALRLDGVEEFIRGICRYTIEPEYSDRYGARVYKISRDEQGNRLTHMKITGGALRVRDVMSNKTADSEEAWEEKVNQIRIYSGVRYESVQEAEAGTICTVTGLTQTFPGQGFGIEEGVHLPLLEPVLTYQIILPDDTDANVMLPKLRQLEEEEPELHIIWDEESREIRAQIMGEVQIEILQKMIEERFNTQVSFGQGNILYKETIKNTVEGVGHFEPLRHYAEVHLLLEPLPKGSGIEICTDCSEDILDKNWQRLVVTHLKEREHRGVLTGSVITDMKITLISGRAHQKHTEGGDFRQATYRAVRQGLMQAESMLLEPYYDFTLEIPDKMVGRAMTDLDKMYAKFELRQSENEMTIISGSVPVSTIRDYSKDVTAYTKGHGRMFCTMSGYGPCHNEEEVIASRGYNPDADLINPSSSVFCAHGAGFVVNWDEVYDYMHMEGVNLNTAMPDKTSNIHVKEAPVVDDWIDTEEIDSILNRTYNANRRESAKKSVKKKNSYTPPVTRDYTKPVEKRDSYLLVDGYNIIFAWRELSEMAKINIDAARGKLMDILCNYQGVKKMNLILVFDAYRVEGHTTEVIDYHNIHVVYTKEAETADQYIERFAHDNGKRYDVTVATSDGLEQIIIRGQGANLMSAREFLEEVSSTESTIKEEYIDRQPRNNNYFFDSLSEEQRKKIDDIVE